jgi:pimeloyl-ACP methyl ester carboxylesterase
MTAIHCSSCGLISIAAGTTIALATAALIVRHKARLAERENPPIGRFIEVDGVRLHYVERGQGQPVVLLHGNGALIQDFALSGVLDRAAASYRVIVFDRPGFGYSDRPRDRLWTAQAQADLLYKAIRTLGIDRPVVVGHSWGTLVALSLALAYRSNVKSLVLLSGYYFPTLRLDVPLFSTQAIPVLGDLMHHTLLPLLGRLFWPALMRRIFGPLPVPVPLAEFPLWLALRPSQLRASSRETAMMIPTVKALSRRYGELSVPVVILAGATDRMVTTAHHSRRLHRQLPESRYHEAPGVGHMVHHHAPKQVMAAIDEAAGIWPGCW